MIYLFKFLEQNMLADLHIDISKEKTIIKLQDKSKKTTYRFGRFNNYCEANLNSTIQHFKYRNDYFALVMKYRKNDSFLLMELVDLVRQNSSTVFTTKNFIDSVEVSRNNKVIEKHELLQAIYNDFNYYNI